MAIPTYEEIMLPFLKLLDKPEEVDLNIATKTLAQFFNLTLEEESKLLPSGQQAIFRNRVGWARTYLKKAGLVEIPKRGFAKITEPGLEVLRKNPSYINDKFLEQFQKFREFKSFRREKSDGHVIENKHIHQTPQELIETAHQDLMQALASDILQAIKSCSPRFFENLVVEVLVKMGYGGSRDDAKEVIGRPGDEGIDGIIKEDRLGLDMIYTGLTQTRQSPCAV